MQTKKETSQSKSESQCDEKFIVKKQIIDKKQNKMLSELGKTVAELNQVKGQAKRQHED